MNLGNFQKFRVKHTKYCFLMRRTRCDRLKIVSKCSYVYRRFCLPKLHIVPSKLRGDQFDPQLFGRKCPGWPQMLQMDEKQLIFMNKEIQSMVLVHFHIWVKNSNLPSSHFWVIYYLIDITFPKFENWEFCVLTPLNLDGITDPAGLGPGVIERID